MATFPGLLEFHGKLNLLKAGILAADLVNTVSPNYAVETVGDPVLGCGLEGVLGARGTAYTGILNGADYATWDPRRDPALPAAFGPGDLEGKARCRRDLLAELGLVDDLDKPLCGFVGRLVTQKGIDLLLPVLGRLARDGFEMHEGLARSLNAELKRSHNDEFKRVYRSPADRPWQAGDRIK